MKLSDLGKIQNPLSGEKGSLLDPGNWISNILGVLFLFVVFATGQHLANALSGKVPLVSTQISPIVTRPQAVSGQADFIY